MNDLTIETKLIPGSEHDDPWGATMSKAYKLKVNGIYDSGSFYVCDGNGSGLYESHIQDKIVIDLLLDYRFEDVGKFILGFTYKQQYVWWERPIRIVVRSEKRNRAPIGIFVILQFESIIKWKKEWSILDLSKEFKSVAVQFGDKIQFLKNENKEFDTDIGIEFSTEKGVVIKDHLISALEFCQAIYEKAIENILTTIDRDSLLTYFVFPEEIKSACKQYLVYFSQFLLDIGIVTDTTIKDEVNRTLFKISPKDENEGLERIKEALFIYLKVPFTEELEVEFQEYTDLAVVQWKMNVQYLRDQINLATSLIEAKQTTIESLQLSNFLYKQIIESKEKSKPEEKEEDIIKGIVTVKKFEGKGFSIDFAEILRRLKRVLSIKK